MIGRSQGASVLLGAILLVGVAGCATTVGDPAWQPHASPAFPDGGPMSLAGREPKVTVEEVFALAALNSGLDSLGSSVKQVIAEWSAVLAPDDAEFVRKMLEDETGIERLRRLTVTYFVERFDRARFERLATVLRQPLLRRMVQLEEAAATAPDDAIQAWVRSASTSRDGRARFRLAERLDAALEGTDSVVDVLQAVTRAVVRAANETLDLDEPISPERVTPDRGSVEGPVRLSVVGSLAYTYRDASIADIEQYLEYLESDLGRWFSRLQRQAAIRAASTVAERAARRIIELSQLVRA